MFSTNGLSVSAKRRSYIVNGLTIETKMRRAGHAFVVVSVLGNMVGLGVGVLTGGRRVLR